MGIANWRWASKWVRFDDVLRREMREGRNRPSVSPPKFGLAWIPLGVARFLGLVIGAQQLMDWTPYLQKLNLGWNLDRIAPNLPRATWKICLPMTQLRYIACLYSSMQNRHKQCSIIGWVHIASWSQPWAARLHATIGMKHIPVVAENKHCSIFHWSGIENFEKLISIRNWIVRPPH
jgi:hypothetical protein